MKGHLEELMVHNQEYMDARLSEDVFGGDYTSEVELKYLEKDYNKLQNRIKELEQINEEHRKINGQLMNNWNCLREYYKRKVEETKDSTALYDKWTKYSSVLDKMNELESGDNK